MLDLGSKGGTILNNEVLKQHHPYQIKNNDEFTVGMSTRKYKINLDYTNFLEYLEKRKKNLKMDMKL